MAKAGESQQMSIVESPTVSIVTVVRNGRRFVEEAIRSVLEQDYAGIEYIVIDGGSTDGTVDVLRRYDADISSWVSEPDDGIFDAWNKGIRRSTGHLVKLLNADDRLTPGSVSTAVSLYRESQPEAVVIASDVVVIDENGSLMKVLDHRAPGNPAWRVLHPSWYVDARIYDRLGLYATEYRVSSDFEMFQRLRKHGVLFKYSETPLVEFRTGGASSGLNGVSESYRIMRNYFPWSQAVAMSATHLTQKVRHGALYKILGEKHTYRLRRALRGR